MKYITKRNKAALTIKVKHLTAESRIIRHEEKKWKGLDRQFFSLHRKSNVRNESRATQLALALMIGKPYSAVEKHCRDTRFRDGYIAERVAKMVEKYHSPRLIGKTFRRHHLPYYARAVFRWFEGEEPFPSE